MKSPLEDFDLVILGGGTGSTIAAWTFAGQGRSVAVIERKYMRPEVAAEYILKLTRGL